jgi:hypothetical protein
MPQGSCKSYEVGNCLSFSCICRQLRRFTFALGYCFAGPRSNTRNIILSERCRQQAGYSSPLPVNSALVKSPVHSDQSSIDEIEQNCYQNEPDFRDFVASICL